MAKDTAIQLLQNFYLTVHSILSQKASVVADGGGGDGGDVAAVGVAVAAARVRPFRLLVRIFCRPGLSLCWRPCRDWPPSRQRTGTL